MNKKLFISLFITISFIGLTIAILPILYGFFAITFDQGRDFIWVSNQVALRKPSLIGPWGSLTGVFFGPLWFWILGFGKLLFGGNPLVFTLINFGIVYSALFLAFILFRKKPKIFLLFLSIIGFSSVQLRSISGFAFSQHLLPILTFGFIFSLTEFLRKEKKECLYIGLFLISLMFHAEPPTCIFSLPFLIYVFIKTKNKKIYLDFKTIIFCVTSFLTPFLPLIVFDLRNNFLQFNSIIKYVSGENQSLGDILPFSQRLVNRVQIFFSYFRSSTFDNNLLAIFILITAIFINFKMKDKSILKDFFINSFYYIISLLLVFIIFPPELKGFYLDGIIVLFIFWISYFLLNLWKSKFKVLAILISVLIFVINISPLKFINELKNGFGDRKNGGSIYINQKEVLDWIYTKNGNEGFKVYTYVTAVYDYNYQYMFFSYGLNKYGYLPEDFSYLPNQPEYVQNKSLLIEKYGNKIKDSDGLVFLIIEKDDYKKLSKEWLKNFPEDKYELIEEKIFDDKTRVQKRKLIKE